MDSRCLRKSGRFNASLSTLTYPDSLSVGYAPNALGQPTQAGSYATNVTYHPNGAIAGFTYGNGIVHTLVQNARGLPERSRDANGSTAIHDDSYDYDANGNVLAISDGVAGNRGDRDMVYDDLDRLVQATSPMFGTASYTYDAVDNLTHLQVTGGSQPRDHTYCYDDYNRLTNIKSTPCTEPGSEIGLGYDVQGNLANKNGVIYTFDYGNRLRSGGPETYRYDAHGRRVRSSSSAGLAYSLYSQSGQILFQRDERSSKRRQYIYLGGSLVAESSLPLSGGAATVTYQHTDALGSPVATTNSAKTVLQRSEYEPYGFLTNRPMQDGPGYTGHITDAATGLVYMQQRYYDPQIGTFLTGPRDRPSTRAHPGRTELEWLRVETGSLAMANLSQQVHELADRLGPEATWDDVIEQARFRKAVQEGLAAADQGQFASEEEVRRVFAKWGVDVSA